MSRKESNLQSRFRKSAAGSAGEDVGVGLGNRPSPIGYSSVGPARIELASRALQARAFTLIATDPLLRRKHTTRGCRGRNRTHGTTVNSRSSVPTHKPCNRGGDGARLPSKRHRSPMLSSVEQIVREHGARTRHGSGSWIRTNVPRFRAARPAVRRSRNCRSSDGDTT